MRTHKRNREKDKKEKDNLRKNENTHKRNKEKDTKDRNNKRENERHRDKFIKERYIEREKEG